MNMPKEIKEINVRGYVFPIEELIEKNPFNDENGNPKQDFIEQSYAWCEAAHIHRLSQKEQNNDILGQNNFGVCHN